jgi:hypothetical protein
MKISLSLFSLLFGVTAVSASHKVVDVDYSPRGGGRRLRTTNRNERFLADVVATLGPGNGRVCICNLEYTCVSQDGTYYSGFGEGMADHRFSYTLSGPIENVRATVFGGCEGMNLGSVLLNGIPIGTSGPNNTPSCVCPSCTPFTVESSDPELIAAIVSGTNTISWRSRTAQPACIAKIELDFTIGDEEEESSESESDEEEESPNSGGDPHVTTWKGEHFEYHGQCDLTLLKDAKFANGLGLDVQIRTKVVRYWSYIKNVAIKIGSDILEIEGSADADDADAHYWINYEFQGDLETFAGFPVTQELPSVYKRKYIIDLSSKYPGSSIIIQLYKEFVRVKFVGDEEVFGNTVGLMGDHKTGELLARDGSTVMTDFTEFGDEWQVLPKEPKLFHEFTHPQFPELCLKPEDPRGDRKRRLAESTISVEQAEAACAPLKNPLSIKDCVYDILATQDLDMVGAF